MFYVKVGNEKAVLGEATVYCLCPDCGCEHEIEGFWEILQDYSEFDVYGSQYCPDCSKARIKALEAEIAARDARLRELIATVCVDYAELAPPELVAQLDAFWKRLSGEQEDS